MAHSGWLDAASADRRFMMTSGPFDMNPGDTQEVVAALIVGQGSNRLESITILKQYSEQLQLVYNQNFDIPQVPSSFNVYGRGLDGAVDLTWENSMENYYQDYLDELGEFFVFEGYNLYQGESPEGPWHKFATFDMTAGESQMAFEPMAGEYVIDCYGDPQNPTCDSIPRPWDFNLIYNWVVDEETGLPELRIVQEGNNTGITNHLNIYQDYIGGGLLMSDFPYYYAVTAYAVNIEDVRSEDSVFAGLNFLGLNAAYLESPIVPIEVTPQANPQVIYSDTADHVAGNSDGLAIAEYLDPDQMMPGEYQVEFNEDNTWNLYHDGMPVFTNQDDIFTFTVAEKSK